MSAPNPPVVDAELPQLQNPQSTVPGGAADSVSSVVRDLVPAPSDPSGGVIRKPRGNHKTDCSCVICASRRGKAEAIANGTRPPGPSRQQLKKAKDSAINADLPVIHTVDPSSIRGRILQYAELRILHPEIKTADIARKMGLSPKTLYSYITQASREGWLKHDDPIARIDHEIVPRALDNLKKFLDQGDKRVTIETAKGTLFPAYKEAKGISETPINQVLAIKLEMPTAPAMQVGSEEPVKVVQGIIVGTPKELP